MYEIYIEILGQFTKLKSVANQYYERHFFRGV